MIRLKTLYLVPIIILCWQSCGHSDYGYRETVAIGLDGWQEDNKAIFDDIEVKDQEVLNIRILHSSNYKYENIYLKVEAFMDTSLVYDDVFSVSLTNDQGQWLGQPEGDYRLVESALPASIKAQNSSRLLISQYSREPILKGLEQIELIATSLEDKN